MHSNESFFSLVCGVAIKTSIQLVAILSVLAVVILWVIFFVLLLVRVAIDMTLQTLYALPVVKCTDISDSEEASSDSTIIVVSDKPRVSRLDLHTHFLNIKVNFFPHRK